MIILWSYHFLLFHAGPFLLGLAVGLIWPYLPGVAGFRRAWLAPAVAILIGACGLAIAAITGVFFESGMIDPFSQPGSFVSRIGALTDMFAPGSLPALVLGSVLGLGHTWIRLWLFRKIHGAPK